MSNPEAKIVYDIVHEQFAKDDDLPDLVEVKQKKRKFVPQFGKIVFFFYLNQNGREILISHTFWFI